MGVLFLLTGFPSVMGLLRDMPVGNPSQTVSRPLWDHCVTIPQETFAGSFLSVMALLTDMVIGIHPACHCHIGLELP